MYWTRTRKKWCDSAEVRGPCQRTHLILFSFLTHRMPLSGSKFQISRHSRSSSFCEAIAQCWARSHLKVICLWSICQKFDNLTFFMARVRVWAHVGLWGGYDDQQHVYCRPSWLLRVSYQLTGSARLRNLGNFVRLTLIRRVAYV